MLTRRLPATALHRAPATRERREYLYFALAIILALVVTAVDVGLREQASPEAVLSSR
jgi:hypothetical protein